MVCNLSENFHMSSVGNGHAAAVEAAEAVYGRKPATHLAHVGQEPTVDVAIQFQ